MFWTFLVIVDWDLEADHLQEVQFGLGTSVQTLDPERIGLFLKVSFGRTKGNAVGSRKD